MSIEEIAEKHASRTDDWFWIHLEHERDFLQSVIERRTYVHLTQEHLVRLVAIVQEMSELLSAPEVIAICDCARKRARMTQKENAAGMLQDLLHQIANAFITKGE